MLGVSFDEVTDGAVFTLQEGAKQMFLNRRKIKAIVLLLCMGIILSGCKGGMKNTEGSIPENINEIYEAKNPYIGDNSADNKLLGLLLDYFGISDEYLIELVTDEEPYILIVHFNTQPNDAKMWDVAASLLALIDNCSEVKWDYEKNGDMKTLYVKEKDVNANLKIKDIKDYGRSAEELNLLFSKLEEK